RTPINFTMKAYPINLLASGLAILALTALTASPNPPKGYKALFDGKSLNGWFYLPENLPETVWKVNTKNGTLGRELKGGSIWTEGTYGDFVLDLEFKLRPHCNSGIFIRSDPQNPVQGGFEIQLIDSYGKSEIDSHDCGALYDAVVPSVNAVKPAMEWNRIIIRCKGPMIQITLNGERVVDANLNRWTTPRQNPDGSKNKFRTALKDLPRTGNIGFQDHGHNVWFRNVYLKEFK
ncbi:MAG: DUF1080 domain-containing protein, partial [Opitutales bacterium]|nr:DUF1080 domain-containing protein [Opitutales bacterium]